MSFSSLSSASQGRGGGEFMDSPTLSPTRAHRSDERDPPWSPGWHSGAPPVAPPRSRGAQRAARPSSPVRHECGIYDDELDHDGRPPLLALRMCYGWCNPVCIECMHRELAAARTRTHSTIAQLVARLEELKASEDWGSVPSTPCAHTRDGSSAAADCALNSIPSYTVWGDAPLSPEIPFTLRAPSPGAPRAADRDHDTPPPLEYSPGGRWSSREDGPASPGAHRPFYN